MVEFGLKLEDNKVADWSEHYIRYEQLKEILVKCARAQGRLAELRTKRPRVAQQVIEAYAASPQSSKDNLLELDAVRGSVTEQHPLQQQHVGAGGPSGGDDQQSVQSEEASLLRTDSGYYGSTQSLFRSESGISIAHSLHKMASGVTDYFSKSFERTVRDTLKLVKDYQRDFDNLLLEDIQLVNAFYQLQLTNMTQRLDLLKESVAQSFAPPPPTTGEDDPRTTYLETPLRASRKNRVKDLVAKFQKKLSSPMQKTRKYNLPDFHTAYNDESSSVLESSPQQTKELKQQQEREAESIQRALVDLYRTAKLLQNFCIMNYTGFVKIVKKHDKTNKENKNKYASAVQSDTICNAGKDVETLADTMEVLYANWFCDRNKVEARAQLLPKKGDGLEMDWSQLRLGYRMGMCSILGVRLCFKTTCTVARHCVAQTSFSPRFFFSQLWVCWDCVWGMVSNGTSTIGGRTAFPVFRACGGLLILQWFWGCNVWIWTRYRINYIFLFDFNPNFVASPIVIFNEAVDHSLVFLIVMLLYYKAGAHAIPFSAPAGVLPTGLVLYTLCHLVFPWRKRKSMWEAVRFVVTAPMTSPTFFHGYVGDVFTSMVKVFQDMVWTLGFVFSGDFLIPEESKHSTDHLWSHSRWYKSILIPAVTLLPLCIRFNQCLRRYTDTGQRFPHLANSLKYVLSQLVTLYVLFQRRAF
jgi:hypothetical protein